MEGVPQDGSEFLLSVPVPSLPCGLYLVSTALPPTFIQNIKKTMLKINETVGEEKGSHCKANVQQSPETTVPAAQLTRVNTRETIQNPKIKQQKNQ